MNSQLFSKKEALAFGWNTLKKNPFFFIILLIGLAVFFFVPDIIAGLYEETAPFLAFIIRLAANILWIIVNIGLIKISLLFCDGKTPIIDDIFSCTHLFFRFLIGTILYTLIVIGGLILLIIPGLFWAIKFWYFDYFIVDKEMQPIMALKASAAITEGAKWDLFIFLCLLFLINVLGTLLLFVGLFVTIPVTLVALAYIYRKLLSRFEGSEESDEPVTTAQ